MLYTLLLICLAGTQATFSPDKVHEVLVLRASDYQTSVFSTPVPVVVALSQNSEVSSELKNAAKENEGFVAFFTVNTATEALVLKQLGYSKSAVPNYIVYGYGRGTPKGSPKPFKTIEEAVIAAKATIPKDLVKSVESQVALSAFLSFTISQGKLPAVFVLDKSEIPALVLKAAMWVSDSFSLFVFPNPDPISRMNMQVTTIPSLIILIPKDEGGSNRIEFTPVFYDKSQHGAYKFTNLVTFFLNGLNEVIKAGVWDPEKYKQDSDNPRKPPPPPPVDPTKPNQIFEVSASTDDYCSKKYDGWCIIAFLDAAPWNNDIDAHLEELQLAQHAKSNRGRILQFMWVDATCHSSFTEKLGIHSDSLPSIVAVSAKRGLYSRMSGSFVDRTINEFITSVIEGNAVTIPIKKLPQVPEDEDCDEIHTAASAESAAGVDVEEIMREVLAESDRKRRGLDSPDSADL